MTLRTITYDPAQYKLVPVEATVEIVHDLHYFRSEPDGTAYLPFWKHLVDCVPDSLPGVIEHSSATITDEQVAALSAGHSLKLSDYPTPAQPVERQELSDEAIFDSAVDHEAGKRTDNRITFTASGVVSFAREIIARDRGQA